MRGSKRNRRHLRRAEKSDFRIWLAADARDERRDVWFDRDCVAKTRFAQDLKICAGCWRVVGVKIGGDSFPRAKLIGEFGSATQAIRIIDLFVL